MKYSALVMLLIVLIFTDLRERESRTPLRCSASASAWYLASSFRLTTAP